MTEETAKVILKKKLRQNKKHAGESCVVRRLLEVPYAEKKKQGGSRGQKKEQVAKEMKTSERHYEEAAFKIGLRRKYKWKH